MIREGAVAADVMDTAPPTVDMDASLAQLRNYFTSERTDAVVLEERVVMGVLSEKDVLRALSPHLRTASETSRDVATLHKRAHQVMAHHPWVASPDTPVLELVDAFKRHGLNAIPIVDADRMLLGLVTLRSLLFAFLERD